MPKQDEIAVRITCDLDPDQASLPTANRTELTWDGLATLPESADICAEFAAPVTAFVRADRQVEAFWGSPLGIIEEHGPLFAGLARQEWEFGWHPHLYRLSDGQYQPVYEEEEASEQLAYIHGKIQAAGMDWKSVRIGEAWHSNKCMRLLSALGYTHDSTAIPGRHQNDGLRKIDWKDSPNEPYRPSREDFRVPGSPELPIIEVPMTSAIVPAPYDPSPKRRYLNLLYHPEIFASALENLLAGPEGENIARGGVGMIFHPGELLPLPANDLYRFGLPTLRENLGSLSAILLRHGKRPRYETISRVKIP